jgi:glucose-specific phosphotransferase system IIA component
MIFSPQSGIAIGIQEVPDEVFSNKMLGFGMAIIPEEERIVSPVTGIVEKVFETSHALTVKSEDGLDLLIHVGIDTVNLKGKGFEVFVKEGQKIKVGDPLLRTDLNLLKEGGYPLHTPIVIMDSIRKESEFKFVYGEVISGKTVIAEYI